MSVNLEPVVNLPTKRRKTDINFKECIFCQASRHDLSRTPLYKGGSQGLQRIKDVYEIRLKHNDHTYGDTLQLLSPYLKKLETHEPKWHKTCYASFNSKANIQSLLNRSGHDAKQGPSTSETAEVMQPMTRQLVQSVGFYHLFFTHKQFL